MNTKGQKTILIVEDEPILSIITSKMVSSFGYAVVNASTGELAVETATSNEKIDLVLMDIDLGKGIDGTQAARQILEKKHIPIVFLTSHSEKEYVDKVKEITRYGYVIKNSGSFVLQSSIEMAFELFNSYEKILTSETRLNDIILTAVDWVWEVDENGVYTYLSQKGLELLGFSSEEIIGKTPFDFMPPEEAKRVAKIFSEIVISKKQIKDLENWNIKKNGEKICLLSNGVPIIDRAGNLKGYRGVDKDITERRKAEEEIRSNELKFHNIINASPIPYALNDEKLNITYLNPAFIRTFGYDLSDIPTVTDWWPKAYPDAEYRELVNNSWLERLDKARKENTPFEPIELSIRCKNGETKFVLASAATIEGTFQNEHLVILSDITERKKAEKALLESEQQYKTLIENIPEKIFLKDINSVYISCNKHYADDLGIKPEEISGKTDYDFYPKELAEKYIADDKTIINSGKTIAFEEEYSQNGVRCFIHTIKKRIADSQNNVIGVLGVFHDITERKKIEEKLQRKEELLNATGRMAKVGGWKFDAETMKLEWTEEVYRIHEVDFSYEPIVEKGIAFYAQDSIPLITEAVKRAINNGESFDLELEIITAKGNRKSVHSIGQANFENGKVKSVSGTFQDITERKKIEDKIQSMLKEKEILLREVHHRIKNNIATVSGLLMLQSASI